MSYSLLNPVYGTLSDLPLWGDITHADRSRGANEGLLSRMRREASESRRREKELERLKHLLVEFDVKIIVSPGLAPSYNT